MERLILLDILRRFSNGEASILQLLLANFGLSTVFVQVLALCVLDVLTHYGGSTKLRTCVGGQVSFLVAFEQKFW